MPKGVVTPREVQCRNCGLDFVTDRAGKAGWYCSREECIAQRKRRPRKKPEPPPRPRGEPPRFSLMAPAAPERPPPPEPPPPPREKKGPLDEELEIVLAMAERHGANARLFRESIQAIARGEGDQRFHYRRVAATAMCLSAYIGGRTV